MSLSGMLLAVVGGFIVGVLVNLLADDLPVRRYRREALRTPFASPSTIPPAPHFFPRAPLIVWSGWGARLTGLGAFASPHWTRRLTVELFMPLVYIYIVATFGNEPRLLFLLLYAALFTLIAVVDMERRWILTSTLIALACIVVVESIVTGADRIPQALRGAQYGFVIAVGVYILGIVFAHGVGMLRRRRIGRTVFGFGDVWLVASCGLIVGWPNIGFALVLTAFMGAAGALVVIFGPKRGRRGAFAIPYAPYIVLGTALVLYLPWLVGVFLSRLYLR